MTPVKVLFDSVLSFKEFRIDKDTELQCKNKRSLIF